MKSSRVELRLGIEDREGSEWSWDESSRVESSRVGSGSRVGLLGIGLILLG